LTNSAPFSHHWKTTLSLYPGFQADGDHGDKAHGKTFSAVAIEHFWK